MEERTEAESVRALIRDTVEEFIRREQSKAEPAYKAELLEERKKREQLERRLNDVVEESRRNKQQAEEAERSSAIRAELQRLGVAKVDLAFKAVKDDIVRGEDGRLVARGGEQGMREFVTQFVNENPELLPARIAGGAGSPPAHASTPPGGTDLEKIRPGMSAEEAARIREEIARVAAQTLRGA